MYRIKLKSAGESIVEVMVAMAVSSLLIMSAIELIGRSYTIVGETNKRIEGMTLAQEGIEIVRNLRDTNWLKYSGNRRDNWMRVGENNPTYLNTGSAAFIKPTTDSGVTIDLAGLVANTALKANSATEIDYLSVRLYRDSDGFLGTDASNLNTPSPYYRTIKVTPVGTPPSIQVTVDSEVFWKNLASDREFKSVKITTDLYDFYEIN